MLVYELPLTIFCKKDIPYIEAGEAAGQLFDKALCLDERFLAYHEEVKDYKFYVHDLPYPGEADGVYRAGRMYALRLRTVKEELADYFLNHLRGIETDTLRCIRADIRILPKRIIEKAYSLTPVVVKNYPQGYWKSCMPVSEFEGRLFGNLIKKYKHLTEKEIDENFDLYEQIRIKNTKPIRVSYKGIGLLGDKLELVAAKNEMAQELLYMALGTGMGENNTCGCGFLNCRWL